MRIFVEGGGDEKNPESRRRLRAGFRDLLRGAKIHPLPQIVACGGREDAFREFKDALRDGEASSVLLVDSESPVSGENADSPWMHLAGLKRSPWERPENASNDNVGLMARCMEAWILADPDALARHYKIARDELRVLDGLNVEEISPRKAVTDHLNSAAQKGGRTKYHKTRDGFALIGKIDPLRVANRAPHAKRFFDILRQKLGAPPTS